MKYKLLTFIVFTLSLFMSCLIEMKACVKTTSNYACSPDKDFIVQVGALYQTFGENVVRMKRQYSETDVFCIKKGATAPAYGTNEDWTYYDCTTSKTFDNSLKAGIGYAISWFNSSDKSDTSYAMTQIAIHKILAEKNGEETPNLVGVTTEFNNLYNAIINEYNAYKSASLKLSSSTLYFTLKDGYYVSNYITVTKNYLSSYNYDLKIDGVSKGTNYVELDGNKIRVKIPVELITTSTGVSLSLSTTKSYNMANMKDCASNKQPIAESHVTPEIKNYSVSANGTITPNYCIANFKANDKNSRIQLYETLKSQGKDYSNLLNFNELDAEKACTPATCNTTKTSACLEANFSNNSTFNLDNVSCYTNTVSVNAQTAYCTTSLNVVNKIGKSNFSAKAGQMYITSSDGIATQSTLSMDCYLYGNNLPSSFSAGNYSEYLSDFNFGGKLNMSLNPMITLVRQGTSNLYKATVTVDYYLKKIYANNGNGTIEEIAYNQSPSCKNCKFLGYGKISKFSDNLKNKKIRFNFQLNLNRTLEFGDYCTYTITPELIEYDDDDDDDDGKLQLEFRTISVNNPFSGKEGKTRQTGSNWCNGDDCTATNQTVTKYIIKRNDSYDKTGKGPKYKIKLTPSDIKSIRKYNKKTSYDDYTLVCDSNGENCNSRFLQGLKTGNLILYDDKDNVIGSWTIQNKLKEDVS